MLKGREMKRAMCVICQNNEVLNHPRYPGLVCSLCEDKALDRDDHEVFFCNELPSGGLVACHIRDDGTKFQDHDVACFINDIECHGVEFRFGGTGVVVGSEAT